MHTLKRCDGILLKDGLTKNSNAQFAPNQDLSCPRVNPFTHFGCKAPPPPPAEKNSKKKLIFIDAQKNGIAKFSASKSCENNWFGFEKGVDRPQGMCHASFGKCHASVPA